MGIGTGASGLSDTAASSVYSAVAAAATVRAWVAVGCAGTRLVAEAAERMDRHPGLVLDRGRERSLRKDWRPLRRVAMLGPSER